MSTRRSVMSHKFSEIPDVKIPRSSFDRSHGLKTCFNSGDLIPILVDEALPGDTFNLKMTGFARLATPLKPILDNLFMETFFFAVPMRLLWDNWEKFNGAQTDPGDSTDFTCPTFSSTGGVVAEGLFDYLGVPPQVANIEFNAFSARAYQLIWNEWFRDQNLQDSIDVETGDSTSAPSAANYPIMKRGKRHDYFTSCLPWPQKGDSVNLPLGISAPVTGTIDADGTPLFDVPNITGAALQGGNNTTDVFWDGTSSGGLADATWNDPALDHTLIADLSTATAATINQIRQAFQIQRLLERDARGGTRYIEIIRSHFGVTSPDFRLQRPEYLGGGSTQIGFTPVPQTTQPSSVTEAGNENVGDLAAYATAQLHNHGFIKSFTEHCMIIGLINVRADLTYQQGLPRMFSRQTRYDYFWPSLALLGEQAVLNREIFLQGTSGGSDDTDVFGYQERYAEYRYKQSMITGLMRSDATGTLEVWHLSQDFANLPVLDDTFIEENPPIQRIVAVQNEPEFIFDAYFDMRCARPMPLYGVPGMIDHF